MRSLCKNIKVNGSPIRSPNDNTGHLSQVKFKLIHHQAHIRLFARNGERLLIDIETRWMYLLYPS